MSFTDKAAGAGVVLMTILNLAVGVVQVLAVFAGVQYWLDWHWLLSSMVAGLLVFVLRISILNAVIGVLGAHYAWHWSWLAACALFFGLFALIAVVSILAGAGQKALRW